MFYKKAAVGDSDRIGTWRVRCVVESGGSLEYGNACCNRKLFGENGYER
mgnify:CR=1 FL=1